MRFFIFETLIVYTPTINHVNNYNIKKSIESSECQEGQSPATSATHRLLDLASIMVGPLLVLVLDQLICLKILILRVPQHKTAQLPTAFLQAWLMMIE